MATDELGRLHAAVRGMAVALGNAGTWSNLEAVAAQLTHHKLTGTALLSAYAAGPRRP